MEHIINLGLMAGGFVLLVGGADVMVRYASRLGILYGLRPVIVGATIVAFGTSAPELLVSFISAVDGRGAFALGNAVGSNVANIGLVLGLAALLSPLPVSRRILFVEYGMALVGSLGLVALAWDGALEDLDGLILLSAFALFFTVYLSLARRSRDLPVEQLPEEAAAPPDQGPSAGRCWLLTLIGTGVLAGGGKLVVMGAESLASDLGLSEALIGATVLALGTSLPEVAASVVAAVKKQHDIAIGNVLGSNLFNVLFVVGPPAIYPGIHFDDPLMWHQMVLMLVISLLLFPLMRTGFRLGRLSGLVLVLLYLGFLAYCANHITGWWVLPDLG